MIVFASIPIGPDFEAFWAGFQLVVYTAIAVVVAFIGIAFIRKVFGI